MVREWCFGCGGTSGRRCGSRCRCGCAGGCRGERRCRDCGERGGCGERGRGCRCCRRIRTGRRSIAEVEGTSGDGQRQRHGGHEGKSPSHAVQFGGSIGSQPGDLGPDRLGCARLRRRRSFASTRSARGFRRRAARGDRDRSSPKSSRDRRPGRCLPGSPSWSVLVERSGGSPAQDRTSSTVSCRWWQWPQRMLMATIVLTRSRLGPPV